MNLTIAGVLRTGGIYDHGHVRRLYRACQRKMVTNFRFVCLTNDTFQETDYKCKPLVHKWPGWWSKIELFRPDPDLWNGGRILYIDLDSLVVGNLDVLISTHRFKMCRDFMGPSKFNSSVMCWDARDGWPIYEAFLKETPRAAMTRLFGDQDFIGEKCPVEIHEFEREHVLSYKVDCKARTEPPPGARVVTFHGKPKPENCDEGWIKALI